MVGSPRRWLAALACASACAGGSSNATRGGGDVGEGSESSSTVADPSMSSSQSSGGDETPMSCVPGMQVECACPGGDPGAQPCLPDGSGFAACECPGDESEGSGTSTGNATGKTEGSSSDSGTGVCAGPCDACTTCAALNPCSTEYQACMADDRCKSIIECTSMCGLSDDCAAACSEMVDATMESLALFEALRACIDAECGACM